MTTGQWSPSVGFRIFSYSWILQNVKTCVRYSNSKPRTLWILKLLSRCSLYLVQVTSCRRWIRWKWTLHLSQLTERRSRGGRRRLTAAAVGAAAKGATFVNKPSAKCFALFSGFVPCIGIVHRVRVAVVRLLWWFVSRTVRFCLCPSMLYPSSWATGRLSSL